MGPVHDTLSSVIIAQLLFLQSESSQKPIHMYINSPGGSVTAGLAIYDTMQYIQSPVATWYVLITYLQMKGLFLSLRYKLISYMMEPI